MAVMAQRFINSYKMNRINLNASLFTDD